MFNPQANGNINGESISSSFMSNPKINEILTSFNTLILTVNTMISSNPRFTELMITANHLLLFIGTIFYHILIYCPLGYCGGILSGSVTRYFISSSKSGISEFMFYSTCITIGLCYFITTIIISYMFDNAENFKFIMLKEVPLIMGYILGVFNVILLFYLLK